MKKSKHVKIPRKTTLKKLLFGDFDGDGTKNIDDPMPFSGKKNKFPDPMKSKKFYQNSRYGNNETLLSDVLKSVYKTNNKNAKQMKTFLENNPKAFGRTKTVPSTIKKLKEKHYNSLKDIHGTTILVDKRKDVMNKIKEFKKKYKVIESKNFYQNPKDGVYYAYHLIINKNGTLIEVQVKTRKMYELVHKKMHTAYKNKDVKKLNQMKKIAYDLYKKGY